MLGQAERLEVEAPAKINLYLAVLGRRSNGYHDIQSVVVPVAVFDRVVLEKSDGEIETIVESGPGDSGLTPRLPPSDENLTTRAAKLLKEFTSYPAGAVIRLGKQIPVGGGLGGGSSDAAAVLNGLNRLWGTGVARAELMRIGAGVGCDVPAFVHGGAVLIEGMGERVSPLAVKVPGARTVAGEDRAEQRDGPEPGWWLVIVNPGFCVSTRDIYSRHQLSLTSGQRTAMDIVLSLKSGDLDLVAKGLFNSLQDTAFRKYPLLGIVRETLIQAGALGALLSGSGASVFGLARNSKHAHQIAAAARQTLGKGMWIRVSRILPDGVMAAHGPLEA